MPPFLPLLSYIKQNIYLGMRTENTRKPSEEPLVRLSFLKDCTEGRAARPEKERESLIVSCLDLASDY